MPVGDGTAGLSDVALGQRVGPTGGGGDGLVCGEHGRLGAFPGNALQLSVAMAAGKGANEIVQVQGENLLKGFAASDLVEAKAGVAWTGASGLSFAALTLQVFDGTATPPRPTASRRRATASATATSPSRS